MKIKITNLESGKIKYTNDFYFFEEQGIRIINDNNIATTHFGQKLKIEFVNEGE